MIYLDTINTKIIWDENNEWVLVERYGYVEGEAYRETANLSIDILAEKGATKLLSNWHASRVISQEDQKWTSEDWFPRAIVAGFKSTAMVVPQSVLAKMSVTAIESGSASSNEVKIGYFSNLEEAQEWLRNN